MNDTLKYIAYPNVRSHIFSLCFLHKITTLSRTKSVCSQTASVPKSKIDKEILIEEIIWCELIKKLFKL